MTLLTRGTAKCPECGATASVIVTDGHFKLVCDTCLFEMWGETVGPDGMDFEGASYKVGA